MKKIVSILTVAAVLATSVFAADISAKAKIDGSLLNYDGTNVSALSIKHGNEDWNPNIALSANGDAAGASFKFYDTTENKGALDFTNVARGYSIWFKPADVFKVTVGNWATNLNQEHIGWCNTDTGIDSYGYAFNIASGAVSFDIFLAPGWDAKWFEKDNIKETYLKFNFGADFGTINAELDAKDNFKNIKMAAGYNGTFGSVTAWTNVLAFMNNGFQKIRVEADVVTTLGSIGWELFVAGGFNPNGGYDWSWWHVGASGNKGAFCGIYTRFNIPVSAMNLSAEIKVGDVLAKPFAINIKPGLQGSVGTCGWEGYLDCNINDGNFTLDVPVAFTVNF